VNAYLLSQNANAVTWFNGIEGDSGPYTTTVLLGENANDTAVYEEWLHVQEGMARGWLGLGDEEALAEEIRVRTQVVANADWLGTPSQQLENMLKWLESQGG